MKIDLADKEVEIDGERWNIPKLTLQDSYPLYSDALNILIAGYKENNPVLDLKQIVNEVLKKFNYENALYYANKCKNLNVNSFAWNIANPFLIMELVGHVIIHNVLDEIKKKDIQAFVKRMSPFMELLSVSKSAQS